MLCGGGLVCFVDPKKVVGESADGDDVVEEIGVRPTEDGVAEALAMAGEIFVVGVDGIVIAGVEGGALRGSGLVPALFAEREDPPDAAVRVGVVIDGMTGPVAPGITAAIAPGVTGISEAALHCAPGIVAVRD